MNISSASLDLFFLFYDECHPSNTSYAEKNSLYEEKIVQCGFIVT